MAVEERIRVFRGAQELRFSNCKFTKSDDQIVDRGEMEILEESTVTINSVIDITKSDGTTTIFSARTDEIKKDMVWAVKMLTNGYELNNIFLTQVYENQTPEYIVEDVITTYTANLTYASSNVSGITLTKYIARGYAIDILTDMMNLLEWQIRIDESDNLYFEPRGNTDVGKTFTQGTNIYMTSWSDDKSNLMNRVKIKGGLVNYYTTETGAGDGGTTVFTLLQKPWGTVTVKVDGVEQTPSVGGSGTYSVDAENKEITFAVAPAGATVLTFTYAFQYPVVVDMPDDASVATYGEIYKEFQAPMIDNFSDARQYARNLLATYSEPLPKAKGYSLSFDFDREVGEVVIITDATRGFTDQEMIIRKITYDFSKGQTQYEFGTRDFILFDWQREVQDRIKKLERRTEDEQDIADSRFFSHTADISVKKYLTVDIINPVDSFVLGHKTLSRLRTGLDYEADCSDSTNTHHGTWHGTGVTTGAQFTYNDPYANLVSQWKLYENEGTTADDPIGSNDGTISGATWTSGKYGACLDFDGADDYVEMADAAALRLTSGGVIEAWIYPDTDGENDRGRIFDKSTDINGTNGYTLWITTAGSDTDLHLKVAGGTVLSTTGGAITLSSWNHVLAYFDGTNRYLFVNGEQEATDSEVDVGANVAGVVRIGNRAGTEDSTFDGKIDVPRIYSSMVAGPLTETVRTIYNMGGKENFLNSYGIFNGSDLYCDTTDHSDLDGGTNMSVAVAVKVASLPGAETYLMNKYDGTDGWAIRINASNKVEFVYWSAGSPETIACDTALTANQFQHVVFTKAGTALIVYVDGVSDNTATASSATVGTNTSNFEVGRYSTNYHTGNLDEVRIYTSTLTAAVALKLSKKFEEQSDCVLWWSFDNPNLGDSFSNRVPFSGITVT